MKSNPFLRRSQQPFDRTYIPARKSRGASNQNSAPNASSDQPPSNN